MRCAECNACCFLFPIPEINKPENKLCEHYCDGCDIHDRKPKMCIDYNCAYLQYEDAPESLRPDQCGIVFTKKTDRIFSGILVPGVEVTDMAKGQINAFLDQGYSVVLLSTGRKPHVIPEDGREPKAVYDEYAEAISGAARY